MQPTAATVRGAARPALRMPVLLGTRAFRRMAMVPAVVLVVSAAFQIIYLVGPDLPNGEVWRKVGYLGLLFSLVALISPLAAIALAARAARSARRAWSIRACDVVFEPSGIRLVGSPAHGFVASWSALSPDGIVRDANALRIRGHDRQARPGWLDIPWPDDAEEQASLNALADTLETKIRHLRAPPPVREPPDTPHCHHCGAALAPSSESAVICGHCRSANQLAPAVVEKVRAVATIAERRRGEAELAAALLRQRSAHAANVIAFGLGLLMMLGCLLVLFWSSGLAFVDGLEAGLPRVQGVSVAIVGAALAIWAVAHWWLSNRRALRLLTLGFVAVAPRREGEPPGCRECGAPLPDPGPDRAIAHCAYCRTPSLLAADLRERAAALERASGGDDPWQILGRCRRRRRLSLAAFAMSLGLVVVGAIWLQREAAKTAISENGQAAEIPFHDEKVTLAREPWNVAEGRGALETVACFDHLADLLLFERSGEVDVMLPVAGGTKWIQDIAGARREQVASAEIERATFFGDALFALARGTVQRLEGDALTRVYPQGEADAILVDMAPAGEQALFLTTRATRHGHFRIRRWTADGTSEPILVDARQAALSPDGESLAFVQDVDGRFQLVVAPYEDGVIGPRRQLTRGAGHVAHPTWSPQGDALIVLTRTVRDAVQYGVRHGRVHLWLVPFEGREAIQLTEGASLELRAPVWNRDGIWFIANTPAMPGQRCVFRLDVAGARGR